MPQLPRHSGGETLRHVCNAAHPDPPGSRWDYLQLPGWLLVSLLHPGITSQVNYMPSNPHLRVCFWQKETEKSGNVPRACWG